MILIVVRFARAVGADVAHHLAVVYGEAYAVQRAHGFRLARKQRFGGLGKAAFALVNPEGFADARKLDHNASACRVVFLVF